MEKIEIRYKTKAQGLVRRQKETMEEAENQVKYLKQLTGFEVVGIFIDGKLVDGSKPEKREVWGRPPKIRGRDPKNQTETSQTAQPKAPRAARLDEYTIDWPRE